MSDKPSLYVVEKKEVVVLVVLFVLVTVLSFTLGVRYGESVGRKMAHEQELASKEVGGENVQGGAGTLGGEARKESGNPHEKADHPDSAHAAADEHSKEQGEHAMPSPHGAEPSSGEKVAAHDKHGNSEEHGEGGHNETPPEKNPHAASHSPEEAAKSSSGAVKEVVDKNSDEYLLSALKDARIEPPGGKAPKEAKLPENIKVPPTRSDSKAKSGSYVIQVGSHSSRGEAEAQMKSLHGRRVLAEILAPYKDKQGEWHRVVIGGFKTKRDAEREATTLKSKGAILSYFVWRLP